MLITNSKVREGDEQILELRALEISRTVERWDCYVVVVALSVACGDMLGRRVKVVLITYN